MPRNTEPSQRKSKRQPEKHPKFDEPLHKRLKNDAFDSSQSVLLAVPSAANLRINNANVPPVFHTAAQINVPTRPLRQPTSFVPSIPPGQLLQHQRMFVPSGVHPSGLPIMNLQRHQIPGLQNIRPGPRPQFISSHIRTPNGTYYGRIMVQPGVNGIRQPIPVVMSPNFNPRFRLPMVNVGPQYSRGPTPGSNVPSHIAATLMTSPVQPIQQKPPTTKRAERFYRCTECLERFPTFTKWEDHQRTHKVKSQDSRILCADPKCTNSFKDVQELEKHLKDCHLQLDLECDFCGQKFINNCDLNNHKKRHN